VKEKQSDKAVTEEGQQFIIDFLLAAKKKILDYVKIVLYPDMRER
jgi:hypothetical protein